jgi:ubiquinone/menaquinone biosynthesis C-methylase UbiE
MECWKGQGLAIRDYFAGDKNAKITIHSSEGDCEDIEVSIFFREFPYIPLIEKAALDLCYGNVIDIGAGAGCHTLELQNRGLQTTAIDIIPEAIDVMMKRGIRDARLRDFRDLKDESFDTVLMLMNGIGIVGDLGGLDIFLRDLGRMVKSDGQVVFDSIDLREEDSDANRKPSDKKPHLSNKQNSERYFGEIEYSIEYQEVKYPSFRWLFVDAGTLSEKASRHRWRFEKVMDYENGRYLGRLYK